MELLKDKADCCGCRTCEKVCPQNAITMIEDEGGFLYPHIDEKKCVDCGLCLKKCAFQSGYPKRKEFQPYYAYGCRHKKEHVYKKSRSGGAFVAISSRILEKKGIVFGVGYEEGSRFRRIIHKSAETKHDRNEFCGSKYVQSDLGDTFLSVKENLKAGRKVLFSGTGCQIGALHSYLGKEYSDLYTIDIICHSTPSPQIWKDFLDLREKELGGEVTALNFRNKNRFGWKAHRETLTVNGKSKSSRIFAALFSKSVMSRPSCFKCAYTNKNRPGDITIADFWGHEKAIPGKWDDDKGISLVLINTYRGQLLWEEAKKDLEWIDVTGYPFRHHNLKHPTKYPEIYEEFWKDYKENGFEYCIEKYTKHKITFPDDEEANKSEDSK
ncbi:Coenzyme F420-reducing hydrogenase, beta subunit [Acetitomaculum ruminis DSM 5522]|uniref:Coenzyme F420-reducing hydrogenase, beta subunit n=1 Tax=Acetitomaculum ruminis DSM 5522 TaxID=1120918 RepID=A0A1I0W362_9FIRM|nr:Coenzyme F420 hydrogenase/dehydrogenase, beta subunit C-terminal domain [Acetitomaculum ruminis]SFA82326.1 Coenzyme F420-reducing hydrogenase, beta subunit [Acetitomaculum ruminis DSM 5522]